MVRSNGQRANRPGRGSGKGKIAFLKRKQVTIDERRKVGSLRDNLVSVQTKKLYRKACVWFFQICETFQWTLPQEYLEFDELVSDAIEYAWGEGEGRSLAGNLLSGLENSVPLLRGALKESWKLWRQWGKLEIPNRAPPLNLTGTLAISFWLHEWGFPGAAIVILLAFHRFLRTAEFMGIQSCHVSFNHALTRAHITFPTTKVGKRHGYVESVTINDITLVKILQRLCRRLRPGDFLMDCSAPKFRILFKAALDALNLSKDFQPYSLRRGGATEFFRATSNMHTAMEIGRWSTLRTAKIYINCALADLTSARHFESEVILRASHYRQRQLSAEVRL